MGAGASFQLWCNAIAWIPLCWMQTCTLLILSIHLTSPHSPVHTGSYANDNDEQAGSDSFRPNRVAKLGRYHTLWPTLVSAPTPPQWLSYIHPVPEHGRLHLMLNDIPNSSSLSVNKVLYLDVPVGPYTIVLFSLSDDWRCSYTSLGSCLSTIAVQ